ncbi:MAG TPA: hypothetical protein VEK35_04700 [Roseiarcus sp.]|nr:hypothetical protein [Roseiarcus sp.]
MDPLIRPVDPEPAGLSALVSDQLEAIEFPRSAAACSSRATVVADRVMKLATGRTKERPLAFMFRARLSWEG